MYFLSRYIIIFFFFKQCALIARKGTLKIISNEFEWDH